jgi:hypothetical protein
MAVPVRSPGLALWIPSRGPSSVMALRAALGLDIRTPQSRPAAACRTILLCQIVQAQAQLQEHLNEQDKCTCSKYSYASGTGLVRYPAGSAREPAARPAGDHGSASLTAVTRPRASPVATWPLPGKLVRNKALGEVSEWKGPWLRPPTACQPLN